MKDRKEKTAVERANEKVWQVVDSEREKLSSIHLAPKLVNKEARLFSCECRHDYASHEWDCGMIFCNKCNPRSSTVNCRRMGIIKEKCHDRVLVSLMIGLASLISYANLGC